MDNESLSLIIEKGDSFGAFRIGQGNFNLYANSHMQGIYMQIGSLFSIFCHFLETICNLTMKDLNCTKIGFIPSPPKNATEQVSSDEHIRLSKIIINLKSLLCKKIIMLYIVERNHLLQMGQQKIINYLCNEWLLRFLCQQRQCQNVAVLMALP